MPNREKLPPRRFNETFTIMHAFDRGINESPYIVTVGRFEDGRIGEVFLNTPRVSTAADAYARDSAILASFCLQYGIQTSVLCEAITRNLDGTPCSPIGALLDAINEPPPEAAAEPAAPPPKSPVAPAMAQA